MRILFVFFALLSLTGCFTVSKQSPLTLVSLIKPKGAEAHYIDGMEVIASTKKKSAVSFGLKDRVIYDEDKAKMYLFLQLKNLSSKPVTAGAENISVVRKEDNKALKVLSYDDLDAEADMIELNENAHRRGRALLRSRPPRPSVAETLFVYDWRRARDPLKNSFLRKHTLQPNESVKGLVIAETFKLGAKAGKNYTVTVSLFKDAHAFHLLRKPSSLPAE